MSRGRMQRRGRRALLPFITVVTGISIASAAYACTTIRGTTIIRDIGCKTLTAELGQNAGMAACTVNKTVGTASDDRTGAPVVGWELADFHAEGVGVYSDSTYGTTADPYYLKQATRNACHRETPIVSKQDPTSDPQVNPDGSLPAPAGATGSPSLTGRYPYAYGEFAPGVRSTHVLICFATSEYVTDPAVVYIL